MCGPPLWREGFLRSCRHQLYARIRGSAPTQKAPNSGAFAFKIAVFNYTAILAALTGRARTTLRAGFALNIISSPLNGLIPFRALVAAFLMTTNLAKPGTTNTP